MSNIKKFTIGFDLGSPEGSQTVNIEFHISKEGVVTVLNGKVCGTLEELQQGIQTNLPSPGSLPPGGFYEAKEVGIVNPYLPKEYLQNLERLEEFKYTDPEEYKRMVLGQWLKEEQG